MSTKLFNHIVYGPIHSRRLGSSLGVNLLPQFGKWCSFNCIYCECGWNEERRGDSRLPQLEEVTEALGARLKELKANGDPLDTITFSGNGEPTMNPHFPEIIDYTIRLRNELYPEAQISVLSNASQVHREPIRNALLKVDNAILKIDSPLEEYVKIIDGPNEAYSLQRTIDSLKLISGKYILQTMFLKGEHNGISIDCTAEENVTAWQNLVRELKPRSVMIYTVDRETPEKNLRKVTVEEMNRIADPLRAEGFTVQVNG